MGGQKSLHLPLVSGSSNFGFSDTLACVSGTLVTSTFSVSSNLTCFRGLVVSTLPTSI